MSSFGWFDWEDKTTTVHNLSVIVEPRKPLKDYRAGEEVVAQLPQIKGTWSGVFVSIGDKIPVQRIFWLSKLHEPWRI